MTRKLGTYTGLAPGQPWVGRLGPGELGGQLVSAGLRWPEAGC